MIEAGAKLQKEATNNSHQIPYNVHGQGAIRQTTCVSAAGQEAATQAHDFKTGSETHYLPPRAC